MSEFQVGDRVRILDSPYLERELREGTIHKIRSIDGSVASISTTVFPSGLNFTFRQIEKFELTRESLPENFSFKARSRKHLRDLIKPLNEIGIYLHGKRDYDDQINDVPNFEKIYTINVRDNYFGGNYSASYQLISAGELDNILGLYL